MLIVKVIEEWLLIKSLVSLGSISTLNVFAVTLGLNKRVLGLILTSGVSEIEKSELVILHLLGAVKLVPFAVNVREFLPLGFKTNVSTPDKAIVGEEELPIVGGGEIGTQQFDSQIPLPEPMRPKHSKSLLQLIAQPGGFLVQQLVLRLQYSPSLHWLEAEQKPEHAG